MFFANFAEPAAPLRNSLWHPDMVGLVLLLVGTILAGVVIFLWVKRWQRGLQESSGMPAVELDDYRRLLDEGLLQAEEFEKIRERFESPPSASSMSTDKNPVAPPDSEPGSCEEK